jgi:predicted CXXCH cytochrome family protein
MQLKTVTYIISFLFISFLTAEAEQENITVHYPPDKAVIEFDILSVSLGIPQGSFDLIKIKVNDSETAIIKPDNEFECFSVNLEPGLNTVEIIVMQGDSVVDCIVRNVYRRSDLIGEYRTPSKDFKKVYFHMGDNLQCTKCHALEPSVYDKKPISPATFSAENFDNQTVIAATSTCYSCHRSITSFPYVHGPVSVWSCLSCHDSGSFPRYSVKKPDTEMCYECHVEQKNEWIIKTYIHGPVNIGKCTICHSPHASQNPFNLFMSTWNLCVNCHFEKSTGTHVLGRSFSEEGHPTRGRPDPVRFGRELTCASCHAPHASNYPNLWAFEVTEYYDLCKKCHPDKFVK